MYPNGKFATYEDGEGNWKYIEVPDPDLAAWDAWGREGAMIERRRRREEYNSKAAVLARKVEARNREIQQEEERTIAEYMKESERRFGRIPGGALTSRKIGIDTRT
jgi:hypothetical protein